MIRTIYSETVLLKSPRKRTEADIVKLEICTQLFQYRSDEIHFQP